MNMCPLNGLYKLQKGDENMDNFKKWLGALKIAINENFVCIDFEDKDSYESVKELYDCAATHDMTLCMSSREFEALLQVYMGSITRWN